jgi:hypothetical protein
MATFVYTKRQIFSCNYRTYQHKRVYTPAYSDGNTTVDFNLIDPVILPLRLIYDENKNKTYDSGNF